MTRIDRDGLKIICDDIVAAIQEVADKHNIILKQGNAKYTPGQNFSLNIEGAAIGDHGLVLSKPVSDFRGNASYFGLKESDLGRSFKYGGRNHVIVGAKPRSRQSILVKRDDGKLFKFEARVVKQALEAEVSA